ncbi:DUF4179 domain-containing protein [Clostridium sp. FP2]|uniref:DUF4179 domain-containing protein n=1 Tax=Clostridium sp. FP2 TaxID=2724481 RepID=UPI0013E90D58|nr:DUF4179 domain-containing protein [Clostridium sp. FP2]MBZ9622550.1 DUF4179 domain-containing protein [Clostridium sp. FP2]
MNCEDIGEKLIEYIDDSLDEQEKKIIAEHIKECEQCRLELEELQSITLYVENKKQEIITPNNLFKNIKVKLSNKPSFKMKKRGVKVTVIAAAMVVLLTVTVFAVEKLNLSLKWWQKTSVKENSAIEQLIKEGYGQTVDLSVSDNNIKITIENIIGDDLNTLVTFKIEDLQKKEKYVLDLADGIVADGDFNNKDKKFDKNIGGFMNFYSDNPYVQRGCITLNPVTKKQSMLHLVINKINKMGSREVVVKGKWEFNIPVTKYESKTYILNKEMIIDEHKLTFEEVIIAPTATVLKYKDKRNSVKGYSIDYFSNITLIGSGKEYKEKVMGSGNYYSSGGNGWDGSTVEFDSMYIDNPGKVKIKMGKYGININNFKKFNIDMNKAFPQEFEYMGSKIIIKDIMLQQDTAKIIITESLDNRNYENLDMGIKCANNISITQVQQCDGYTIDKDRTKVSMSEGFFAGDELNKPKSYVTKRTITLKKASPIEKKDKIQKIIPMTLDINGYSETRYIDKSIKVKLH